MRKINCLDRVRGKKHALILGMDMEPRHRYEVIEAVRAFSALNYGAVEVIAPESTELNSSLVPLHPKCDIRIFPNLIKNANASLNYLARRFNAESDHLTL